MFQHRSGRVIALGRLVLAIVFFLAVWIDPAQPVRETELGYALVGGYLAMAITLMVVAMRSWWWDHRMAWSVLVLDVFAFLATVFFTEGVRDDFTSPFLAFFTFLMLAATIRWDWRVTAAMGLIVTTLYLLVGTALVAAKIDIDVLRFGRRVAYMAVLSLILIWFGLQRREQHIERFADAPEPSTGLLPPLESALQFALEQTGAKAGAIAWSDDEEPQIQLRTHGMTTPGGALGPSALAPDRAFGSKVRLFSSDRTLSLRASNRGRPIASVRRVAEPLADLLGVGQALALPFSGGTGRGEIIVTGIIGVCADHIAVGTLIAREVAAAFDRHAALVLSHQTALARSRDGIARDLHDSVAQSLAGAALRLEGLRNTIRQNGEADVDAEIVQLKDALRAEQTQVRGIIDRLRQSEQPARTANLQKTVVLLASDLSSNWGVRVDIAPGPAINAPSTMAYEIGNMLREAVANAVRHGGAAHVAVNLRREGEAVTMVVADDGSGFAADTGPHAPRSIRERVARQGGALKVETGRTGTNLTITLPSGEIA